jgi:PadR family transcriptional regulator PadR
LGEAKDLTDEPMNVVAEPRCADAEGPAASVRKFQKELSAGTVALVLLALLDRTTEPLYGYQIAKELEAASNGGLPLKQGTLYPVLRSLEAGGLLMSRVEPSIAGPPRRYYSITDIGRQVLVAWRDVWTLTRDFVNAVLEGHLG